MGAYLALPYPAWDLGDCVRDKSRRRQITRADAHTRRVPMISTNPADPARNKSIKH
jgi:hypothetical protein